ncbi:TPA: hypothetical protein I1805_002249 [Staphylococcus pseudintermedius]|uniref:hypothetical protein n=1 Tax=Staphylococcus aureus TaxID=1280 RepID=UPI0011659DC8|nr:hypothetical protein [Staphylococcus aureus]EHS7180682.1 hypothetical protein [Staphylococcus pseudintermedius]BBL19084.1 hypothetical protein SAJRA307_P0360 [Staphylococcus aureus]HAR6425139.1 hypothetical protein [Staphylococcus pseudintermedius]
MTEEVKNMLIQILVIIDPVIYRENELKEKSTQEIEKIFELARKQQVEEQEN